MTANRKLQLSLTIPLLAALCACAGEEDPAIARLDKRIDTERTKLQQVCVALTNDTSSCRCTADKFEEQWRKTGKIDPGSLAHFLEYVQTNGPAAIDDQQIASLGVTRRFKRYFEECS